MNLIDTSQFLSIVIIFHFGLYNQCWNVEVWGICLLPIWRGWKKLSHTGLLERSRGLMLWICVFSVLKMPDFGWGLLVLQERGRRDCLSPFWKGSRVPHHTCLHTTPLWRFGGLTFFSLMLFWRWAISAWECGYGLNLLRLGKGLVKSAYLILRRHLSSQSMKG